MEGGEARDERKRENGKGVWGREGRKGEKREVRETIKEGRGEACIGSQFWGSAAPVSRC